MTDIRTSWSIPHTLKISFKPSKPLFHNCILCPISVLLKLSCAHKPPQDLNKSEHSDLVLWRDSWDSVLLTGSQKMPVLLVCKLYSVWQGPRQHVKHHRYRNVCFQHTAPQSASVNYAPPLASHMTLGKLTCRFENPLSPLQNKDIYCHVSHFLPWLSVIFSQHTL